MESETQSNSTSATSKETPSLS